jgi:type II secretory pathway pseudopilin PulG
MSLVELLVVVAILGLLAVAILPTVASTTESRRTREAARVASSFIASAQTRALGRREWSGFRVVPTGAGNVALDLTLVDVPPSYRGDVVPAKATMSTTGTASVPNGVISFEAANALSSGDRTLIRFGGRDPWYSVSTVTTNEIIFNRRSAVGQENTNTPWPPTGEPLDFEITGAPAPYGTTVTLGEGRAIDITWSGHDVSGAFTPFNAGTITVLYDGTGRLRQVVHPAMTTNAPGTLFFLVGRADRAGQLYNSAAGGADESLGANWQYADSFWVMINPATGTVHQAACDPTAATAPASQSFVRAYLSAGGGS